MAKNKLIKLTRQRIPLSQFAELMFDLSANPTREAVLLGASSIDVALEYALETKFIALPANERDMLFDGNGTGPLASVHSKLQVSYALGLVSEGMRNDIRKINRVRNVFAHCVVAFDLDSPEFLAETTFEIPKRVMLELSEIATSHGGEISDMEGSGVLTKNDGTKLVATDMLLLTDSNDFVAAYIPDPRKSSTCNALDRVIEAIQVSWFVLMVDASTGYLRSIETSSSAVQI